MRQTILKTLYKLFPFDLKGDCDVPPSKDGIKISCVINFYGRLDLLSGILHSLAQQDFSREDFEVVLIEDQGGTLAGREMCESFIDQLQIVYRPLDKSFGKMGYSRNFGLTQSRGEYILFLDDDTVVLQKDFLSTLVRVLNETLNADALIPHGHASYSLCEDRYDFHDPYFMTSRCMVYRRSVLIELKGFMDGFVGQEDVEFVVRFTMADRHAQCAPYLHYYHPPLLVGKLRKPMAVGMSFFRLRKRYPFCVWLLVLLNCCRHAPLILLPSRKNRESGKFGLGFILGLFAGALNRNSIKYG